MSNADQLELNHLHHDHATLATALDELERNLDRLEVHGDFDQLDAIAHLIQHEVTQHFPREEALVATVLGEDSRLLAHIARDHDLLGLEARDFFELAEKIRAGLLVDRGEVVEAAAALLQGLRRHLLMEEGELVPALRARVEADA
ncbi:MAG: hemerythrin domain-containing protein [bacterium]